MSKQLIIVGFHRSGTSMLAQELHNAGLFVGDKLMGPHISNADGHFEDEDFFTLHEKILKFNNQSWQFNKNIPLKIPKKYHNEMKKIIANRNANHKEWGFKDPRNSLFLEEWSEKLDNPYVVVIYRHFEACVNSLLHRQSRQIAYNGSLDNGFWQDPTLAYRMWLAYNQKIIAYAKANPQTTIVISHEAVLDGFPIIETVAQEFGFDIKLEQSGIKKSLLSPQIFEAFKVDEALKRELEETWNALQSLSLVETTPSIVHRDKSNKKSDLNTFEERCKQLNIPRDTTNPTDKILDTLALEERPLKEKIRMIRQNRALFNQFNANNVLIRIIQKWIKNHYEEIELYFLIAEIYMIEKNYSEVELNLLKVFAISSKIFPYYYDKLANLYVQKNDLVMARHYINQAIQGNPKNPHFYLTSGKILYGMCDYENALIEYDKAITLNQEETKNPNIDLHSHFLKITLLYELDRVDELKEVIEYLEVTYPEDERIAKRKNTIFEKEQKLDNESKKEELKNKLEMMREDKHYYAKLIHLFSNIENEWMREDLIGRMGYHLEKFQILEGV
ncbi:MAG: hypothetical protein U9O64_05340 [Campylobacterota bacterium]|nr:hypothetical protein [Campylobacterota bacterium]